MRSIGQHRDVAAVPWSTGALLLTMLLGCGGEKAPATDTSAPAPAAAPAPATAAAASGGEALYQRCVTCHQATGAGIPGSFPPLAGSEYATAANVAVPIRIVLHGIQGALTVKGTQYNGVMPPYGTGVEMTDDEVASVLTYVRQAWGNAASPVTAQDVAKERAAKRTATGPVTEAELKTMM